VIQYYYGTHDRTVSVAKRLIKYDQNVSA